MRTFILPLLVILIHGLDLALLMFMIRRVLLAVGDSDSEGS